MKLSFEYYFFILLFVVLIGSWSIFIRLNNLSTHSTTNKSLNKEIKGHGYLQKVLSEANDILSQLVSVNISYHSLKFHNESFSAILSTITNQYQQCQATVASLEKQLIQIRSAINTPQPIENLHPTSVSVNNASQGTWLVIGIPTVSRPNNEDYLIQTVKTMTDQLSDDPSSLIYHQILIIILNMEGPTHMRFFEAEQLLASDPRKAHYFRFLTVQPEDHLPDSKPGATSLNDLGNANRPGYRVRKQTRNIVTVMNKALAVTSSHANQPQYYMFLEDDMLLCPLGFLAIQYLLDKASRYHPDWLGIRLEPAVYTYLVCIK